MQRLSTICTNATLNRHQLTKLDIIALDYCKILKNLCLICLLIDYYYLNCAELKVLYYRNKQVLLKSNYCKRLTSIGQMMTIRNHETGIISTS